MTVMLNNSAHIADYMLAIRHVCKRTVMPAPVLDHSPARFVAAHFERPQRIAINLLKRDADTVSGLLDALHPREEHFSDSELDGRVTCNTRSQRIERSAAVSQTQQKCGMEVEMDGTGKLAVIVDLRTLS
jgi:hypothetical protein